MCYQAREVMIRRPRRYTFGRPWVGIEITSDLVLYFQSELNCGRLSGFSDAVGLALSRSALPPVSVGGLYSTQPIRT